MHEFLTNACFPLPAASPATLDPLAAVRRSFGEAELPRATPAAPAVARLVRRRPARLHRRRVAAVA